MVEALYREDPVGEAMTPQKIRATIDEHKARPDQLEILLLHLEEQVVGYAFIASFWSNEHGGKVLCIDEFYVKEHFRNQGIGSAFLQGLEQRGDCVAITLEVTPTNKEAQNLYMNRGYAPSQNSHLIKKINKKDVCR